MITTGGVANRVRLLQDGVCNTKIAFKQSPLHLSSNHESGFCSRPNLGSSCSELGKVRYKSSSVFTKTSICLHNERYKSCTVSVSHGSVTPSFFLCCNFGRPKRSLTSNFNIGTTCRMSYTYIDMECFRAKDSKNVRASSVLPKILPRLSPGLTACSMDSVHKAINYLVMPSTGLASPLWERMCHGSSSKLCPQWQ